MNRLSDGSISYSEDGGVTWTTNTQIATLGNPVVSAQGKNVVTVNSRGMTQFYISSFEDSSDYNGRLAPFDLENVGWLVERFRPHPFDPNAIIALGRSTECQSSQTNPACVYSSYYSKDFGRTWKLITSYTSYLLDWAPSAYNTSIRSHEVLLEDYANKTGNGSPGHRLAGTKRLSLVSLESQYAGSNDAPVLQPLQENILGSVQWKGVIFATKPRDPARPYASEMQLYTSHDNGKSFKLVRLPKSGEVSSAETHYSILDISDDGAVFINVRFNNWGYGNIYSSDANGDNYALNLRYAAREWLGGADFGVVSGIEGVYLSNVELTPTTPGAELETRITFDNGGEWFPLTAPELEIADCGVVAEECFLHLRKQAESWKRNFFTTPNDIGLIIGTGNVGRRLKTSGHNTYLSNNAGKSWSKAFDGRYTFEVSQNGGILIAARDDIQTSTLKWSSDSGRTWKECLLPPVDAAEPVAAGHVMDARGEMVDASEIDWTVGLSSFEARSHGIELAPHLKNNNQASFNSKVGYGDSASEAAGKRDAAAVNVLGLTRVPSQDASARFIVSAYTAGTTVRGFIYLDFNATEARTCQGWDDLQSPTSDYEPFSPSDKDGDGCILGRKIVYARKKPAAECWVAHTVPPTILFEVQCQCSRQDFMCDYCFAPNATHPDICELDCPDYNPALPPATCQPGSQWRRTLGYRRVAGTKCTGGVDKLGPMENCPAAPTQMQPVTAPVYTPPLQPPVPVTAPVPVHVAPRPPVSPPTTTPVHHPAPVTHAPINVPIFVPTTGTIPDAAPTHQKSKILLPAVISGMTIVLMLGVLATLFFLSARNARVRHGLLRCVPDSWLPAYVPPDREGGPHYHPLQGTSLSANNNDDIFNDDEFLQEDANVLEMDEDDE